MRILKVGMDAALNKQELLCRAGRPGKHSYRHDYLEEEMNLLIRKWIVLMALMIATPVGAEMSAKIGWASDYYYRGIFQADSSANGGIDYTKGGFYVGTWVADVGKGLEVDGYFGFGGEAGGFDYSIGFTGYYYKQDVDDSY